MDYGEALRRIAAARDLLQAADFEAGKALADPDPGGRYATMSLIEALRLAREGVAHLEEVHDDAGWRRLFQTET